MSDVITETTKIAKKLAKASGLGDGVYELFLQEAYRQYYGLDQFQESSETPV